VSTWQDYLAANRNYLVSEGDGRVAGLVEAEQANVDILDAYAELAANS